MENEIYQKITLKSSKEAKEKGEHSQMLGRDHTKIVTFDLLPGFSRQKPEGGSKELLYWKRLRLGQRTEEQWNDAACPETRF